MCEFDREYVESVIYYATHLIRLLEDCENEDFVDTVVSAISSADKAELVNLFGFQEG